MASRKKPQTKAKKNPHGVTKKVADRRAREARAQKKQPAPRPAAGEKLPHGRPTDYRPEYDEIAYKLCLLGATDAGMGEVFGVSEQTINAWKQKHPSFLESIARGKRVANAKVAGALFERACGYSHPEDKIMQYEGKTIIVATTRHYPPDTAAISLFLRNREPELWKEKVEVATTDNDLPDKLRAARFRVNSMRKEK